MHKKCAWTGFPTLFYDFFDYRNGSPLFLLPLPPPWGLQFTPYEEQFWIFAPNSDVMNQNKTTWKTEEKLWSNWSYWNLWSFYSDMKNEIWVENYWPFKGRIADFEKVEVQQNDACSGKNLWDWNVQNEFMKLGFALVFQFSSLAHRARFDTKWKMMF